MKNNNYQIFELAISRAKADPKFSKDLANYFKYLVLKNCPEKRLNELNSIFKHGNLQTLFDFAKDVVPDCSDIITNYVRVYK